jgi:hypothetical protein
VERGRGEHGSSTASAQEELADFAVCGVHNKILDSGFRRNDGFASFVFPGKAEGRDPESREA